MKKIEKLYGSLIKYPVFTLRRLQAVVKEPAVSAGTALAASTAAAPGTSSEYGFGCSGVEC